MQTKSFFSVYQDDESHDTLPSFCDRVLTGPHTVILFQLQNASFRFSATYKFPQKFIVPCLAVHPRKPRLTGYVMIDLFLSMGIATISLSNTD